MSTRSELMNKMLTYSYNPALLQRIMIEQVEQTYTGGLEIVDPTNPFVFLLEAAATLSGAAMVQAELLNAKQYPTMALTEEDLYRHMSDKDYLGRFAMPSEATITLLMSKSEIYAKAVDTDIIGVKKIVIPRHTEFTVGGIYKFTMQYPIEIKIMAHGGLQIVYNNDLPSPIQNLSTNQVDWTVLNYNLDRMDYIRINIPILQFAIETKYAPINSITAFKQKYSFEDQFYYCRVYKSNEDGSYTELKTTHSDQVFDPLVPTALLKVTSGVLSVEIPQIYLTTELIKDTLRIDIYTTKGPLELNLGAMAANEFVASWKDIEGSSDSPYYSVLSIFNTMAAFGTKNATGGRNAISFEELRRRVINNITGINETPVTPEQVNIALNAVGFSSLKYIDNVTNRIYLATKELPAPNIGLVTTGCGLAIGQINETLKKLSTYKDTVDNGERLTLLPNMLYKSINGILTLVSDIEKESILSKTPDEISELVNSQRFLYSPFYYVLDITENQFETRAYYLDSPEITKIIFNDENATLNYVISVNSHFIEKTDFGFRINVLTASNDFFKELEDELIIAQMSFKPSFEIDNAYITGKQIFKNEIGERLFQFDLISNYDFDQFNNICLTNFTMYDTSPRKVYAPLNFDLTLTFIVKDDAIDISARSTEMDTTLGYHLLTGNNMAMYQETLSVSLGTALTNLWKRSRSVITEENYLRYVEATPAYYENDVYGVDETGTKKINIVDGKIEFVKLHSKGDPILSESGEVVYAHLAGEPVLDHKGNPILIASREIMMQSDILMLDGSYYFATNESDLEYKKQIPLTIVTWIKELLEPLANTLEETSIYFYPKATLGYIETYTGEDKATMLYADQTIEIDVYVSDTVYKDSALRKLMEKNIVETLNSSLSKNIVTEIDCMSMIKSNLGLDAIGVEMRGLGGILENIPVISLKNDAGRLCLGKKMIALADKTLSVRDDIKIEFLRHSQK